MPTSDGRVPRIISIYMPRPRPRLHLNIAGLGYYATCTIKFLQYWLCSICFFLTKKLLDEAAAVKIGCVLKSSILRSRLFVASTPMGLGGRFPNSVAYTRPPV